MNTEHDQLETERISLILQGIEVILRAVAALPASDQATARMAIDSLTFHEGIN